MAYVSAEVHYASAKEMGDAGWYVTTATGEPDEYSRMGPVFGPFASESEANGKAARLMANETEPTIIDGSTSYDGYGGWKMQAIYQHADGRRVLYASKLPTADAVLIECVSEGLLPILDIRPYGPLAGPSFDVVHGELNFAEEDRAANAELQSRVEKVAEMKDMERPSRAVEILDSVGTTLALPENGVAEGTTWEVASSSDASRKYTVTLRADTRFGGDYLHCDCIGWPTQRGKGKDCRHVTHVRAEMGWLR